LLILYILSNPLRSPSALAVESAWSAVVGSFHVHVN